MIDSQYRTLPGLLDEMAERFPARDFVVYGGERLTYAMFRKRVHEVARGLRGLGVKHGDKVALLMGNQSEWLVVCFATTLLGAKFVALNTWWRYRELKYALNLSETDILIMSDRYLNNDYVGALGKIRDWNEALPHLKHVVCLGAAGATYPGLLPFDHFVRGGSTVSEPDIAAMQQAVEPGDNAFILFTSGSTTHPKAVLNEHWGVIRNEFGIGERMHLSEHDRILVPISLFWGFGIQNAVFAALTHGACLVLQHRFDAGEMLGLIESEKCTGMYVTPNMALALDDHPDRGSFDLSSLRTGLSMPSTVPHLAEMGAHEICSFYGLTEAYGNSTVSDAHYPLEIRSKTWGRPLPQTDLVIADPVTHQPLPRGSVGEIKVRGFVMPGYFREPDKTREAIDGDGYLLTGDLGMLDDENYLHFCGRLKEMVKSGGINVSPVEVEEMLRSCEGVDQAYVVGVPDPKLDEVLAAAIIRKAGAVCAPEQLTEFCKSEMAAYKVPKYFAFLQKDDVPLTDTGKIDKAGLQRKLSAEFVA